MPSTKINLPENLNLYCQVYCQVVPPMKLIHFENLKIDIYENYGIKKDGLTPYVFAMKMFSTLCSSFP